MGKAGLPGDARDVDDGVESAVLVDQLSEQAADRLAVGHRYRGGPGRATRCHDATGGALLRLLELLGAVEAHQRVDGDHEPTAPAELLGDRCSDPASAAGHHGDPLARAHGSVDRTLISRPSKPPASSH